MKQLFSVLAVSFVCCCYSCNNDKTAADTKDNSLAQKNLASSHIVTKAFETGDVSAIDSAVAADFVDHTDRGEMNRDSLKTMITMLQKSEKNMKGEVIKELADDGYVMSLMRYTGSTDGSMGMPAGPYDMKSLEVIRFKDGKAVEHWSYMDPKDIMKMMPPPPPPMEQTDKMDKMKKK